METNFRTALAVPDGTHHSDAATAFARVMPRQWRTVRTAPVSGLRNMAIDAALLDRARETGEGALRCYAWERPTVSFGRNEAIVGRITDESISRAGLDAVRRQTGGRALLHAREVTYSVTVPLAADVPWRVPYALINDVLLVALRALHVQATLVTAAESAPVAPDGPLCFARPAVGEIAVGGAKLVGSAVWRERGAYLQHGSILLHDDQALLQRMTAIPAADAPPAAATLAACAEARGAPCPRWEDVADALELALAAATRDANQPLLGETAFDHRVTAWEQTLSRVEWLWRR